MNEIIRKIEAEQLKENAPEFHVGDTVKVYAKIKEGNRERIQVFEGTVLKRQGGGARETFTVRKTSNGIGVEKTWPVHSPHVERVEVVRRGKVRRAKLNYLRQRVGKAAKVKELVKESIRMPICDLPFSTTEILEDVDFYIVTHLHPDHFDMDNYNEVLDRNIPIFIQNNAEADFMKNLGFKDIKILQENGSSLGKIKLTRVEALHGSLTPCGPASGLIFEAEREPTIYFAGDTIMYDGVKSVIEKFKPDIIILNVADAFFIKYGHLIMDEEAIDIIHKLAPNAKIIASHLDNVAHAYLTRNILLYKLIQKGIEQEILIPNDGQIYDF